MKSKRLFVESDSKGARGVQRRALLQGAAALACGAAAPSVASAALAESAAVAAPQSAAPQSAAPLIARDGDAVAATR